MCVHPVQSLLEGPYFLSGGGRRAGSEVSFFVGMDDSAPTLRLTIRLWKPQSAEGSPASPIEGRPRASISTAASRTSSQMLLGGVSKSSKAAGSSFDMETLWKAHQNGGVGVDLPPEVLMAMAMSSQHRLQGMQTEYKNVASEDAEQDDGSLEFDVASLLKSLLEQLPKPHPKVSLAAIIKVRNLLFCVFPHHVSSTVPEIPGNSCSPFPVSKSPPPTIMSVRW